MNSKRFKKLTLISLQFHRPESFKQLYMIKISIIVKQKNIIFYRYSSNHTIDRFSYSYASFSQISKYLSRL